MRGRGRRGDAHARRAEGSQRRVRTKHAALEFRMGGLAVPRKTTDPETEGLPVDEGDDSERDQRIPCGEPEQLAVGQGKTASGQSADQLDLPVRSHVIYPDFQPVIRGPEIEIKAQLQIAERRIC